MTQPDRDEEASDSEPLERSLSSLSGKHRLWMDAHLREETPDSLLARWQFYMDLIATLEARLQTLPERDRELMEQQIRSAGMIRVNRHWDFHLDHLEWFKGL